MTKCFTISIVLCFLNAALALSPLLCRHSVPWEPVCRSWLHVSPASREEGMMAPPRTHAFYGITRVFSAG